ncbi:MAG: uncharacterized membrane protein (DUF106 family) [Flavobacteriaceae bacterium]|jgi:uncharacterized membrane protein (DUF106 family)|tara:strand:- start:8131 stop:8655 length:525 start_codon:yes stop_codon:yes gene_type:complete
METQQNDLKSTMITYGLILGGITVVFQLMLFFLEMHYQQTPAVGIVSLIIMIGLLVFAFIQYKKLNEGYISLSEAIKIGLGISLISALIGVVYSLILTNVLDPDTMQKTLDFTFDKMRAENPEMPQNEINNAREMSKKFTSPMISSAFQIIGALFIGFIISLIGGLIVKKSRPE